MVKVKQNPLTVYNYIWYESVKEKRNIMNTTYTTYTIQLKMQLTKYLLFHFHNHLDLLIQILTQILRGMLSQT